MNRSTPSEATAPQLTFGLCLLCSMGPMLLSTQEVKAQVPASWNQLKAADARLAASQITWKKVIKTSPNPRMDLEKYRAQSLDLAKQRNLSPSETAAFVESAVGIARATETGSSQKATIKLWHRGQSTRADAFNVNGLCYAINFSDGRNFVTADVFDHKPVPGVLPTTGTLVRDQRDAIQYTASQFGDLIFLAGSAVTGDFTARNAKQSDGPGDTLILEQNYQSPQDKKVPLMARISVSKKTMRPIGMDVFIREPNRTRLFLRYTPSDPKVYPGGVQFPSRLRVEAFGGRRSDGSEIVNFTEDFQVVRAAFNEAADLTDLKAPPGTRIGDIRFGREATVSYTIDPKGMLPSDDKVLAMLKAQGRSVPTADKQKAANKEAAAKVSAEQQATAPSSEPRSAGVLALSALFVLSGMALWTRSKRT